MLDSTIKKSVKDAFSEYSYHSGSECVFVKVTSTWGIKLYTDRMSRDFAIKKQRCAFKDGVGPKVGKKFNLKYSDVRYYG